jgi:hypothetical protein
LLIIAQMRRWLDRPAELASPTPEPVEPMSEEARLRTNAYLRRIGILTQIAPDGEIYVLPEPVEQSAEGTATDCSPDVPRESKAA